MTVTPPDAGDSDHATDVGGPDTSDAARDHDAEGATAQGSGPSLALPPAGTGERAARRRRANQRRRLRTTAFATALVVLIGAVPVLGLVGYRAIRDSTAGRRIDAQNDPRKPRYEANVIPTPTAVVFETDGSGQLVGAAVLSLGGNDIGGAVILVPATTLVADTSGGSTTLAALFSHPGDDVFNHGAAHDGVAQLLGIGLGDSFFIAPDNWKQWVGPTTPLSLDNPDRVSATDSRGRMTVRFAAGPITLSADDVADYLHTANAKESDLALLNRRQVFWTAWLTAIKSSSNPNIVPGESTTGLGRFLRGLARGDARVSVLPVHSNQGLAETFTPDPAAIADVVRGAVPLPTALDPGERSRVRLLSGTGPIGSPDAVAARIVGVGGELTLIGNADRFDYTTTQIIYYDDAFAVVAARMQQALGLGTVSKSPIPTDTEDVTIILGKDADARYGGNGG